MTRAMYMSKLYAPTLKEDPADAELASHRLLLRAGMIRKEAAGLYSYLPLAWRSIRKIENIVLWPDARSRVHHEGRLQLLRHAGEPAGGI